MDYKKLNMALVITVIILLAVATFAFLKVLFSDSNALEWGSVSDFISSISTFGTLLIAFFAYKAAPQWIQQKRNEEGFKHVSTMLEDYDAVVLKAKDLYYRFIKLDPRSANSSGMKMAIDKDLANYTALLNKLESCKRWKISYPKEVNDYFNHIKLFYAAAYTFARGYDEGFLLPTNEEKNAFTKIYNELEANLKYFHRDIEEIFKFPK